MSVSPTPEEAAAVIREGLLDSSNALVPGTITDRQSLGVAALDVLVAALRDARRERDTAVRERDNWHASNYAERQARLRVERERDQARDALAQATDLRTPDEKTSAAVALATAHYVTALQRIERNAANNGDEFTRMLARAALGGAAEEEGA